MKLDFCSTMVFSCLDQSANFSTSCSSWYTAAYLSTLFLRLPTAAFPDYAPVGFLYVCQIWGWGSRKRWRSSLCCFRISRHFPSFQLFSPVCLTVWHIRLFARLHMVGECIHSREASNLRIQIHTILPLESRFLSAFSLVFYNALSGFQMLE